MKLNRSTIIIVALALVVGIGLGGFFFSGSSEQAVAEIHHDHDHNESGVWTCSMHPQVRQSEPGSCPFCGMDLIPLASNSTGNPSELTMSAEAIALANVQTSIVQNSSNSGKLMLNGKVKLDERRVHTQTTHFGGRIEKLYKNFEGETIRKGDALASIYSPQLVAAQEEFLETKRMADSNPTLYEAAKRKLKYWKISDSQIAEIEQKGEPLQEIELLAEFDGIITKKFVNTGDHLMEGGALLEISDLSNVWVVFDVYEKDLDQLEIGQLVSYRRNGSNEVFEGPISFISPEVNPNTRVVVVRVDQRNNSRTLKPDMFVKGSIAGRTTKGLLVDRTAVLWTGKRSIVYIKTSADWTFELREIELGNLINDQYEVLSGLSPGDEIVTNGAFIIDAEAQLQGKSSMMMPTKNESTKAGFVEISLNEPKDYQSNTSSEFQDQLLSVALAYIDLKDAMVGGSNSEIANRAPAVTQALETVDMTLVKGEAHLHWMELHDVMKSSLDLISKSNNRDQQRLEFINLSNALINSVRSYGTNYDSPLYIQFCPMANNDLGANWISKEENIINPYFGDMMLTCGSVEEIINQ